MQPSQSETDSLSPDGPNLTQPNWSRSNDLQSLADSISANHSMQLLQPGTDSLSPDGSNLMQPNWSRSNDLQSLADPVPTYHSMQPPGSEFIWTQPKWSGSNDLHQSDQFYQEL